MKIKQINLDCYDCAGPLNDSDELIHVMQDAAKSVGAKVIGDNVQYYPAYGVTAIVFLAESHILVSTYPEHYFSVVEVFMCNSKQDPYACSTQILRYIKPNTVKTIEFDHTIGESPIMHNKLFSRVYHTLESVVTSILDRKEYCRQCGSFDYSQEFVKAKQYLPIGQLLAGSGWNKPKWHFECNNCQNEWYK